MKRDEPRKVIDPSFTATELIDSLTTLRKKVERPGTHTDLDASALSTAELAEVAARRVGASVWRGVHDLFGSYWDRLKTWDRLKNLSTLPPAKLVAGGVFLFLILVVAWIGSWAGRPKPHGTASGADLLSKWVAQLPETDRAVLQRELARGDRISALIYLRGVHPDGKTLAVTLVMRAALANELHEPVEALEALEQAVKVQPAIAGEPIYVRNAVQTFAAGRTTRTQSLLGHVSKEQAVSELSAASTDWSYRVRHGAVDLLKVYGTSAPDEVAVNLLDLWQAENCESRRAIAGRLLAKGNDDRIGPAIEAASRRQDDGCLSSSTARARATRH